MAKEGRTYRDLLEELKTGTLAPVYLFHGEEDFLADQAVESVTSAALKEEDRNFNLEVVHGSEVDAREIIDRAESFPMTPGRRVVVVREAEKLTAKDLELIGGYVDHPSPTTCLVLVASKADLRKKPFSAIHRAGRSVEFKPLYESQLPAWIAQRVAEQGGTISDEASRLIAAYVGTSLRELQAEIEKLFLYLGQRHAISADDVAAVVGMSKEFSVFELQKSVGARDVRRAVEIMEHMLDAGESAPFVIVMLTGYFLALWKLIDMRRRGVPEREQAAAMRINPYFMKEYTDAAGRFNTAAIERAFRMLTSADEQLKTTAAEPKQVMHLLLIQLLQEDPAPA